MGPDKLVKCGKRYSAIPIHQASLELDELEDGFLARQLCILCKAVQVLAAFRKLAGKQLFDLDRAAQPVRATTL
jgi:hypothetical protein